MNSIVCIVSVVLTIFLAETGFCQLTIINVKELGAKGDGVSNDTRYIDSAFKIVARAGGTVYFPKGFYCIAPIAITFSRPVNVIVRGEHGSTYIKRLAGISASTRALINFRNGGQGSISISSLTIDGNSSAFKSEWTKKENKIYLKSPCSGIEFHYAKYVEVTNCIIKNIHGSGISAYEVQSMVCSDNSIGNVEESGIRGEAVVNMSCYRNQIRNAGICPVDYVLDGIAQNRNKETLPTMFGDGISGYCDKLIAKENYILNPGRIGIVHDLAVALGYKKSSAIIEGNTIVVNSQKINNANPPSGMWFEQSAFSFVKSNRIILKASHTNLHSAIRFYSVSDSIVCTDNFVDARSYNRICENGISIEYIKSKGIEIKGNKIVGKIATGILNSYSVAGSKTSNVDITGNIISDVSKNGILVIAENAMPERANIINNTISFAKMNSISITGKLTKKYVDKPQVYLSGNVLKNSGPRYIGIKDAISIKE
ncbi:MAG: hypothetical protein INR69_05100 [Mucilaginibacter polytrichastri]|nr:hypothetical protein [Mucilaginibacter polytrichastri]